MTSVFQARRRAEEFAAAVDGGAGSSAARGQELTTLLGLVAALREQEPIEPRAAFSNDLRSRLIAEAETALQPGAATLTLPVRQRGRRERRLVAAASAFVLIGGTTTMAAAAQGSLPGDALYPIKRSIERAEAQLSMSSAGKGKDLLNQASDRLVEVRGLVEGEGADPVQSEPRVPETLRAFSDSADEGSALLFESFRSTGDPESVMAVRSFASEGIAALEALADTVPPEAQDELASAAILLHDIDSEATALCSTCAAGLPVVEVPDMFLARADVDRALALAATHDLNNNHPVEVRKDTLRSAGKAAGEATSTPTAPTGPADGPAAPSPLPSPTLEPSPLPPLLPGLDGGSKTSEDPSLTQELGEGLQDVVKTLLPDAGTIN